MRHTRWIAFILAALLLACSGEGTSPANGDEDRDGTENASEIEDESDAEPEMETGDEDETGTELEDESEAEIDAQSELPESDEAEEETPEITGGPFRFPLQDDQGSYSQEWVIGVDHDPEVHEGLGEGICTNHDGKGFPGCYDEHRGTDYVLHGGFEAMDLGVAQIFAAAPGVVAEVVDGNYDRCHIGKSGKGSGNIDCDGNPIKANFVRIVHEDLGLVTLYYHMKKDSIQVGVGQSVACGTVLGLVGSSGISSFPHLHFQVEDLEGNVIDPYSGEYSQEESYWRVQDRGNGLPGETCAP